MKNPAFILHYIQNLLLDLLQLVLHLHHNLLHLGMIGLAAQGIDFAAHLLSNEAQLLSLSATVLQRRDEIFQVVRNKSQLYIHPFKYNNDEDGNYRQP